jgi:Cu/Ag efflux pump CusA
VTRNDSRDIEHPLPGNPSGLRRAYRRHDRRVQPIEIDRKVDVLIPHEPGQIAFVVMSRSERTNEMLPKVEAELDRMNHDGTLPVGVKVVPIYNRGSLLSVTTHTVLHNLVFGCLLVFLIQWIFLGNLRSAIIVGLNIPFALLFAIRSSCSPR